MLGDRILDLMNNPVLRWMFRNVVIYKDANDNIKLDKKKSPNKIDGVVAIVDAIGGMMSVEADDQKKDNVWESFSTNHKNINHGNK